MQKIFWGNMQNYMFMKIIYYQSIEMLCLGDF